MERPFMMPDKVKELAKQTKAKKIVIKQPSGGIYEYSSNGTMMRQLQTTDSSKKQDEKQKNAGGQPKQMPSSGQMQLNPNANFNGGGMPMMSQYPTYPMSPMGQMQYPPGYQQPQMPPVMNQYPVMPYTYNGGYVGPQPMRYPPGYILGPPRGAQMMPPPAVMAVPSPNPIIQMNNTRPNPMAPPVGPMSANYPPPNQQENFSKPFPGENVPNYLYPGRAEFSYLPGEGEALPKPELTKTRQIIKQLAALAQFNAYPFWFDNYLNTNITDEGALLQATDTGDITNFPTLQFSADSTAGPAVVGAQFASLGVGVGALVADGLLDKKTISERDRQAQAQANGTPYYYYPDNSYTYYQSLPYQPLPTMPNRWNR